MLASKNWIGRLLSGCAEMKFSLLLPISSGKELITPADTFCPMKVINNEHSVSIIPALHLIAEINFSQIVEIELTTGCDIRKEKCFEWTDFSKSVSFS